MPTVTLIKPRSLMRDGRKWTQGVEEEVTVELAAELEDDPRFRVKGVAQALRENRPTLKQRILDAVADLDADEEGDFTDDGLPNPERVSELAGVTVTAEQIAKATAVPKTAPAPEAPEGEARGGVRITRKAAPSSSAEKKKAALNKLNTVKKPDPVPPASTDGAVEV